MPNHTRQYRLPRTDSVVSSSFRIVDQFVILRDEPKTKEELTNYLNHVYQLFLTLADKLKETPEPSLAQEMTLTATLEKLIDTKRALAARRKKQ